MDARVCCIIDDDRAKKGKYLRVQGEVQFDKYTKEINQIILAMPSASRRTQKEILDICKETECEMKIVPGIYQMINGDVLMSKLRKVEVEDLLGRDPIKVNADDIFNYITGKTILVTGGGGSIGSELCRQIAAHQPETLVIFDVYENNAYDIQMELRKNYPDMRSSVLSGTAERFFRYLNSSILISYIMRPHTSMYRLWKTVRVKRSKIMSLVRIRQPLLP